MDEVDPCEEDCRLASRYRAVAPWLHGAAIAQSCQSHCIYLVREISSVDINEAERFYGQKTQSARQKGRCLP